MDQDKQVKILIIAMGILLILFISFIVLKQLGVPIPYIKSSAVYDYNGFEVYRQKELDRYNYKIKIFIGDNPAPLLISTREDPRDLENILVEEGIKTKIIEGKKELFITMDDDATSLSIIAATEISKFIGNKYFFNLPTHGAMTSNPQGKENLTIKTCNDVNKTTSIIHLSLAEQTRIYSKDDCVIIEGKNEYDLIKAADRLSLTLIGVMEY